MSFERHLPAGGYRYGLFELYIAATEVAGVRGRLGDRIRVGACTLHVGSLSSIGGRASSQGPPSCVMVNVTVSLEPT